VRARAAVAVATGSRWFQNALTTLSLTASTAGTYRGPN
jgi:hypothetical protein